MGSTCNTCETTPTTTTLPTEKYIQFTKQIQELVQDLRKKYDIKGKQARQFLLGEEKIYKGVIKNGDKQGYGQFYNGNTIIFGIYQKNKLNGQSLIVTNFKNYIKANFVHGVPTGQTKQKINRHYFHGEYREGKKSKGILTTDQYLYEGSFKDNRFHGYGILEFENGDRYQGDFYEGLYHGDGVYQSRENGIYKGEFQNGVYHGQGSYFWGEQMLFCGEYCNGLRNGQGKLTKGDHIYEGVWVKGELPSYHQQEKPILSSPPTTATNQKLKTQLTGGSDLTGYVIELF